MSERGGTRDGATRMLGVFVYACMCAAAPPLQRAPGESTRRTRKKDVEDDAAGPDVGGPPIIALVVQHLGRHVVRRPVGQSTKEKAWVDARRATCIGSHRETH